MNALINELSQLLTTVAPRLKEIGEIEFASKPQPNKWSKKEVIGHLVDSAHNNLRRFIVGQYEHNPKIIYDQDFWVDQNQYQFARQEDVILLWVSLNQRIIAVWKSMPPENYHRVCDTGKNEVSLHTLEWLAADYIKHMKHHIDQVMPGTFNVIYP